MTSPNDAGKLIRMYRERIGMTQAQLAQKVNMCPSSISGIERGDQTLTNHTITKIAAALGRRVVIMLPPLDPA